MSYLNEALKNKHVLVTGATGFIGGRLAQRLAEEEGAIVTGTGRNLDKVSFLKDVGVDLFSVDLRDTAQYRELLAGKEVLFHVAAWMRQSDETDAYTHNVEAVESLIRLAAEVGVRRFVQVSTIAAYGVPTQNQVDEEYPLDTTQEEPYGRTKAQGELRAFAVAKEVGIEMTAVRPALVYGPRAQSWSINMVKLIKKGTPVIFGDGSGHAYPLYIDNLVDGMLLTAVHPAAAGEAFNLSDPVITMAQFFTYYAQMCDIKPRRMPMWGARLLLIANNLFNLHLPINENRLKQIRLKVFYPTTKIEQRLGYRTRIPIDEGMRRTETWLRQEGYLDNGM
jgi:2-alkyl-3-oxoalkanoate reductase